MKPEEIKNNRIRLGYSQQEFAAVLGVSFATVNRWENGKAKPQKDRLDRIRTILAEPPGVRETPIPSQLYLIPRLDFEGDPEALKLVVDAYRLKNGHLFNKAFGLELSRVVPLPHQRIAVYEHMLPQNPLRYLLADDAGAGKTIMTGLYIREMVNRGRMNRVLICCPAGLTWNWQRELRHFFELDFSVLRGADFAKGNPIAPSGACFQIISVDTAATEVVKANLTSAALSPFDLIVFDEAHKLSWTDPKRPDSKTRRYRLAEALTTRTTHLLLLTATPHMGKPFPYFALWRLLDPPVFSSPDTMSALATDKRPKYFIRRLKEEMIDYAGQPIYMPRLCQTVRFQLTPAEQNFYEEASRYLRWSYETNTSMNKNAADMVVAVMQRRLASSTFAMMESLKRRRARLQGDATDAAGRQRGAPFELSWQEVMDYLDHKTADEGEPTPDGREADEQIDAAAVALTIPPDAAQLQKELEYIEKVIDLGQTVQDTQQEAKFFKLRELIESAEYQNEKLLIFTEHRDTLEYLRQRFEALGYTGQIASIHGGMDVEEREEQRIFFMTPEFRRSQEIAYPDRPSARVMLATDAAGEGINLQFAWIMVNFDIPWNPARLEQRMGRLHRFGQKHPEVRIFNLVADNTREGEVLTTLLDKLEEARKALCSDKVFDVVGQLLQDFSLRDLLRDALLESTPATAQRRIESIFATQKLRTALEEQRKTASMFGDVARRLGQLNNEMDVEQFSRLLPAYIQNFVEKAAPRLGIRIEGDLSNAARFAVDGTEGRWFYVLSNEFPKGIPDYLSVQREAAIPEPDRNRCVFLRPGEIIFDTICREVIGRFRTDVMRGAVFCDPAAEKAYYIAVYTCQIGEKTSVQDKTFNNISDRRLLGIRWDEEGEPAECPFNALLSLLAAPRSLVWKAGNLLLNPEEEVRKADRFARSMADASFLQQARTRVKAETVSRIDDLHRGYDFLAGELAKDRSELARRSREGDEKAAAALDDIRRRQKLLAEEKAAGILYEERRADLMEIANMERIAVALVVPDPSPAVREAYDKNIEDMAVRIARNFEVDRYKAKVYDVSSPHLARGYDLESHRANGEKVVIEVKGRAGRGSIQLTENEWPTAINVRDRYWLYVVVDCATSPTLYRVQDPAFKLAVKTRQSFAVNMGDIIQEAERD